MKRLARRIWLPMLVLLGLTLIAPQTADAFGWRRRAARRAHVHAHYHVAPRPVYAVPAPRVYAPGVGVHVGPGIHVGVPGVRVNVGPTYSSHYGAPYYYGW